MIFNSSTSNHSRKKARMNTEKNIDLVIFGATGFTGKQIVREVVHTLSISKRLNSSPPPNLTWAIAGRAHQRLHNLLVEIEHEEFEGKWPSKIPYPEIIVADVSKSITLDELCARSSVLINAAGPFRYLGEYVVRSCVSKGCDYLDVSGEPEFIERMQRTYHNQAKTAGVTIVHACGFDSIPADMGVLQVKKEMYLRGWQPAHVEMFLKIYPGPDGFGGNFATYESAVEGFGNAGALRESRKYSSLPKLPRDFAPKLKLKPKLSYDTRAEGYLIPFFFADPSIVRLSQQLVLAGAGAVPSPDSIDVQPPTVQFAAYIVLPTWWTCFVAICYGILFGLFASTPWGCSILLAHPKFFTAGIFSRQGPTKRQIETTSFSETFFARGFSTTLLASTPTTELSHTQPDKQLVLTVRGPEPGYDATPRMCVQCAYTMLVEKPKGRIPQGGVMTPSIAFWSTSLVERCSARGVTFEVIEG